MNTQANKHLHRTLLIGGISAIVVGGIAIGSLAISAQGVDGILAPAALPEAAAPTAIAAPAVPTFPCAECGMIESTREIEVAGEKLDVCAPGRSVAAKRSKIEAKRIRNYEVTIRLQDGSKRVITDAAPERWRQRERVTIIAGME